jgi:hypothetical protein
MEMSDNIVCQIIVPVEGKIKDYIFCLIKANKQLVSEAFFYRFACWYCAFYLLLPFSTFLSVIRGWLELMA